jgi:hypothetical protein
MSFDRTSSKPELNQDMSENRLVKTQQTIAAKYVETSLQPSSPTIPRCQKSKKQLELVCRNNLLTYVFSCTTCSFTRSIL